MTHLKRDSIGGFFFARCETLFYSIYLYSTYLLYSQIFESTTRNVVCMNKISGGSWNKKEEWRGLDRNFVDRKQNMMREWLNVEGICLTRQSQNASYIFIGNFKLQLDQTYFFVRLLPHGYEFFLREPEALFFILTTVICWPKHAHVIIISFTQDINSRNRKKNRAWIL